MDNVIEMSHPLIKHKISLLRDKNTGTNEFRKLIEEIGILMGYEALRDLPLEDVEVETPIETCMTCDCSDSSCRSWYGEWYSGSCSKCEGWSYWFIS